MKGENNMSKQDDSKSGVDIEVKGFNAGKKPDNKKSKEQNKRQKAAPRHAAEDKDSSKVKSQNEENKQTEEKPSSKVELQNEEKPSTKVEKDKPSPDELEILREQEDTIKYTITLEEYRSIGGDDSNYYELFTGIDKIYNNVARDAFMIADDTEDKPEDSSKVNLMPTLNRKRILKNIKPQGSEKKLEKRAIVDNHKTIKITTAYTEEELRKMERNSPSVDTETKPFLIYDSAVHYISNSQSENFVIGRLDDCDLVIKDKTVSSHHAAIKKFAGKYYITDNSSNGTVLKTDEIKVKVPKGMFMELTNKMTIVIPKATIVFVC